MKIWSNPSIVSKTPLATVFLLEYANIGQIWRMWSTHTAAGQNLTSWVSVNIALMLWVNFYRVCCPKEKFALWATIFGVMMNFGVILSVIRFRYF